MTRLKRRRLGIGGATDLLRAGTTRTTCADRFTLRRKYSVSLTPVLRTSASYLARLRSLICLPIFPPPLPPLSPTLYK
ncbi:hypothetical protein B0H13DRAFT_2331605 [Mycena leptocephala]|nr:hypothetical protein B0H13DRAFT_2331605 [Mycena leptocephala]